MKRLILAPLIILILPSFVLADTSDPSSVLYRGAKRKTKLDYTLSASTVRGFDEFSRFSLSYSAAATMTLKNSQSVSASISYSHPDDFEADQPRYWGLEDLRLSYTKSGILKSKDRKRRSSLRLSLGLPTAETSIEAGMFFRASASLPTSWSFGKTSLIFSPGVVFSQHKYKSTDDSGFRKNSPLGLSSALILRRRVLNRVTLSLSGSLYNFYDYDFNGKVVQSLGISAFMPVTKKTSVSGGYSWRDTFISNNSLFDDDTSRAYLSLTYQL